MIDKNIISELIEGGIVYLHRGLDAGWQGKHWSCDGFAFDRWTVNNIYSLHRYIVWDRQPYGLKISAWLIDA